MSIKSMYKTPEYLHICGISAIFCLDNKIF